MVYLVFDLHATVKISNLLIKQLLTQQLHAKNGKAMLRYSDC